MRTYSVIVAAFAAAASVVSAAEGQRPKIYFPRHVKRQYQNMTITTETPNPQSTLFGTPETTKRDTLTDLTDLSASFTDKPTFVSSSSPDTTEAAGAETGTGTGPAAEITTVIVESTLIVPPTTDPTPTISPDVAVTEPAVGSTGGVPASIVQPTTTDSSTPEATSPTADAPVNLTTSSDPASPTVDPTTPGLFTSDASEVPTTTSAILLAPTGIVTSSDEPSPTLSDPLAPLTSLLNSIVSEATSAVLPTAPVTTSDPASPSAEPTVDPTTSAAPASVAPSDSPLPSVEPSVQPTDTTLPTVEPTAPVSASPTTPESEQPSPTAIPDPTTAAPEPTSTDIGGISFTLTLPVGTGGSVVDTTPPVTEPTPSPTTPADTTPPATEDPTSVPTSIDVPPPVTNGTDNSNPSTTLASTEPTTTVVDPTTPITVDPTTPITVVDPTTPAGPSTTAVEPTTLPSSGNGTFTDPPVTTGTPETTAPLTTISDITAPPTSEATLLPTVNPVTPNATEPVNTTIPESTTQLPPPPSTSAAVVPTSAESTTASGVTSIAATATVSGTDTEAWLPTTIVVDQTPTGTTQNLAPTSATGIPTQLPKAITPDSGTTTRPQDTTVIQIGFKYGMNYEFVVGNSKAAAQIFQYLPVALKGTGSFDPDKVQLLKLQPLNTRASLGYLTTLALMTYPSNLIDQLRMDLRSPNSPLYNHDEQIVYNLTAEINPAIDIIVGSYAEDGTALNPDGSPASTATGGSAADPFGTGSSSGGEAKTAGQMGTTAGIAVGAVVAASAYGAAMFIIARRYKRKKQAHRRTSSLTDASSEMRSGAGSPHFMGGALLSRDFSSYGGVAGGRDSHGTQGSGRSGAQNSARTAYISGPMSAENSLGWN